MTAVWAALSVIVPVVMLTAASMLLAYGTVVWLHRMELRQRHDLIVRRMDKWS